MPSEGSERFDHVIKLANKNALRLTNHSALLNTKNHVTCKVTKNRKSCKESRDSEKNHMTHVINCRRLIGGKESHDQSEHHVIDFVTKNR